MTPHHELEALRREGRAAAEAAEFRDARKVNNPAGERAGHYTGRCGRCHPTDLWDDTTGYGCKACGAMWCTG